MANDFYAFRANPETDADIILMLENAENRTEFIKACIRVARDHIIEKDPTDFETDSEAYIRLSMEV